MIFIYALVDRYKKFHGFVKGVTKNECRDKARAMGLWLYKNPIIHDKIDNRNLTYNRTEEKVKNGI